MKMKRVISLILAVAVICSLLVTPAMAAETADSLANKLMTGWTSSYAPTGFSSSWYWRVITLMNTLESDLDLMFSSVSSSINGLPKIVSDLLQIRTDTTASKNSLNGIYTFMNSSTTGWGKMISYLFNMSTDIAGVEANSNSIVSYLSDVYVSSSATQIASEALYNYLTGQYTGFPSFKAYLDDFEDDMFYVVDYLMNYNGYLNYLPDILYAISRWEDDRIKDSQQDEKEAWNKGFGSKDRVGSISDMSGLDGGLSSWLSLPDVDISSTFEQVDTGFATWFSQDVADALKVQGVAGVSVLADEEPETPYLDANQAEVEAILAGGDGIW